MCERLILATTNVFQKFYLQFKLIDTMKKSSKTIKNKVLFFLISISSLSASYLVIISGGVINIRSAPNVPMERI